jgi:hypothetical protein
MWVQILNGYLARRTRRAAGATGRVRVIQYYSGNASLESLNVRAFRHMQVHQSTVTNIATTEKRVLF